MRPTKFTLRDPLLVHQVVLLTGHGCLDILVSCNCLERANGKHDPMGKTRSLEESRQLYNNPANHKKPFGVVDFARW